MLSAGLAWTLEHGGRGEPATAMRGLALAALHWCCAGAPTAPPSAGACTEPGGPYATATARDDPVNLAARPLWDQLLRQQDVAEGWPPQPFGLEWSLGRDIHDAGGMPHYMKDGHGCCRAPRSEP